MLPLGIAPNNISSNYKNSTVQTHANITNSKPEILNVTIYEYLNSSARNITISAGSLKTVYCNFTVRDWNGYNDILALNASLWNTFASNFSANDDNNTHYTNRSCDLNASTTGNEGWFVCAFDVLYYANNGTWMCNATIVDMSNYTNSASGTTIFSPVYALNVTEGIDYGNIAVEEYSVNATANITNIGNMLINVSVEGYGARRGDGLAMNCSLGGNITVSNQRFAASDVNWTSKTSLSNTAQMLQNLTMSKQNNSENLSFNSTYWQIYINSTNNPAGNCTGYVIFTAVAP